MIYGTINQKGLDKYYNFSRWDIGGDLYYKVICKFPFSFNEKPTESFVITRAINRLEYRLLPTDIDFFEENELPQKIRDSFDLLFLNLRRRPSKEWVKYSKDFLEILLELNNKESSNNIELTTALLIDCDASDFSWFLSPTFKFQSAKEAVKLFKENTRKEESTQPLIKITTVVIKIQSGFAINQKNKEIALVIDTGDLRNQVICKRAFNLKKEVELTGYLFNGKFFVVSAEEK